VPVIVYEAAVAPMIRLVLALSTKGHRVTVNRDLQVALVHAGQLGRDDT